MTLINVKSLGVTLGAPLFANLDLTVAAGDRIGLVAANGRGKSTLLRCLAGTAEATTGDITWSRGLRVGHVEQDVPEAFAEVPFRDLVLQALPEEEREYEAWRVDVTLDMLDVPEALRDMPVARLSGGWQRLAMLARVWVTEPDVLLMDEPTNHLDLARIGGLQNWLGGLTRDFPVVVASHDRAFLDAVTNRTLFLRAERSEVFSLPYSRARAALDEADAAEGRRYENEVKQAQQLRRQAAKLKNIGINSGSDLLVVKTRQLTERAERIEAAARPAHFERSAGAIRLGNSGTHAKALVTIGEGEISAPDGLRLFTTRTLWISPGDRVVVLGRNGVGKTRLVSLVHAAIQGDGAEGGIRAAASVALGYSDQSLSQLNGDATPLETVCNRFDVGDQAARKLLAGAGVSIDMQSRRIGALSGGQRARLAMLNLRLSKPNFYLLDEPTNHLDIEGQETLEEELKTHEAGCLLVSHDRSFIRSVGNRFWLIEDRRLREVDDPEEFLRAALAAED